MAVAREKRFILPAVHFSSLLFICALLPALLFKGPQIELFAITQIMLAIWIGWIALQSYGTGLSIPKTGMALCLTLFWLWLAISLTWSLAPSISVINFWWVGSLVWVFWLYTLTSDRDVLWSHSAAILLLLGVVLALMGVYEVLVFGRQAHSVFMTRNTHAAFLNLVALPASAYFLRMTTDKNVPRHYAGWLGAALFIMFFSIFLSASRGANVSLTISMILLIALTVRTVSWRGIVLLLVAFTAAFLSTTIPHGGGELEHRLPELLQDPQRLYIWESSWKLLQASPWKGIGLGLYYLAYPRYRNPLDNTAGFFAHDDYLQIWIETGLPGLLFLLAVLAATAWLFIRALRRSKARNPARTEMTGLFCGLLAVAGHSVVDFNLYILSIMMTAGLMMGRLHELACHELKTSVIRFQPSRLFGKQTYPVIVSLLVLLPLAYFAALGLANSYYDKALQQAQEGQLQQADRSLATAERLTPGNDRSLIAHADLYRHAISLLPAEDKEKRVLYDAALGFLDQAQRANSLRALTFALRARLYEQNPALAGGNGDRLAVESYRHALALNPMLFKARTEYANLLLRLGETQLALETLDKGAKYQYFSSPDLIPFYTLTAKVWREAGRANAARDMETRIHDLEVQTRSSYSLGGY